MSIEDIIFCVDHYRQQYGVDPRMLTTGPRVRREILTHLAEQDHPITGGPGLSFQFRGMTVEFEPRLHGIRLS